MSMNSDEKTGLLKFVDNLTLLAISIACLIIVITVGMLRSKKSVSALTKSSEYFNQLRNAKKKSEKVTLDDAKPKLVEILQFLKICNDYTTKRIGDALDDLVTLPEDMSVKLTQEDLVDNRGAIGKYLARKDYAKLFVKIVSSLNTHMRIDCKFKATQTLHNFKSVLRGFCNYTAWCPQLQKDFVTQGGVQVLFPLLEYIDNSQSQCDPKSEAVGLFQQILLYLIPILQNCIKYRPNNRDAYRKANSFQILSNIKSTDKNVQLLSLLTLAYVVDDKQSESLSKSHDCIKLLTVMLEECLKSPDHSVIIHPLCYSIREILDGLNRLIINDHNKVEMKNHGGVKVISQIIEYDSFTEEEKLLAVDTFRSLAFVESCRKTNEIQKSASILQKFTSSENESLREASQFAIWEIKEKETIVHVPCEVTEVEPTDDHPPTAAERDNTNSSGHVMISYQWDSQERAVQIRDKLRETGYNVWMDVDKMAGSILEAMANAVEKSSVVLICMSEKYKDSYNCRSEAEYAYVKKRPVIPLLVEEKYQADGWLGIILGAKLYYKFCCDQETDIDGLLKGIQSIEFGNAK